MALQEIHSWTFGGLIGAFIDLMLAYFLLCGSTIAFFASKIFRFFGLALPCPCKGIFGYKNSNLCVHKILFEWPLRKICSIQVMAAKRFPFDLVWVRKKSNNANDKLVASSENSHQRVVELEDEASCSLCSGPRLPSLADKESGYDAKGKRAVSLKRRSGVRRRRRFTYDFGKASLVIPSDNLQSDVALTSCLACDGSSVIRGDDKSRESINPASGKQVSVCDDEDAQAGYDLDEKTGHNYEFDGSMVDDSLAKENYPSSLEHHMSTAQDNSQIVGNEDSRIKMLENALDEEKAAYAALYLELEKERSAANTAADEAMAMISRLQELKASMEMEMRQYLRMVEERVAYDEEEMDILREILIRREREIYFLEKELEAYRQMGLKGSDQSNGKTKAQLDERGRKPPLPFKAHGDPLRTESTISIVKKDEMSNISSNNIVAQRQSCINTKDEEMEKNTEQRDRAHYNLHSPFYDTDPDVLDVHVIDDIIEHREKANGKLIHNEKLKIGNEIEILGERLRMVKLEKEKLAFLAEKGESEKGQLKLLEEMENHLQQIKQMRNPVRGASLPPLSSKVSMRKRRCRSASRETCKSR